MLTYAVYSGTLYVDAATQRVTVAEDGGMGGHAGGGGAGTHSISGNTHSSDDILIDGWFARNRALHGDKVAVKLVEEDTCMGSGEFAGLPAARRLEGRHRPAAAPAGALSGGGGGRDSWGSSHSGGGGFGGGGGGGGGARAKQRVGKVVSLLRANRDMTFVCTRLPGFAEAADAEAVARGGGGAGERGQLRMQMQPLDRSAPRITVLVTPAQLRAREGGGNGGSASNGSNGSGSNGSNGSNDSNGSKLLYGASNGSKLLYVVRWSSWEASSATPVGVHVCVAHADVC
jgi:hypothetical protein